MKGKVLVTEVMVETVLAFAPPTMIECLKRSFYSVRTIFAYGLNVSLELVLSFVVSPCASDLEAQASETMLLISALGLGFRFKICFFYL